jgi:hypothetical protein
VDPKRLRRHRRPFSSDTGSPTAKTATPAAPVSRRGLTHRPSSPLRGPYSRNATQEQALSLSLPVARTHCRDATSVA